MAYLNQLQNKGYPSLMGFGGVNTGIAPFSIKDSEATDILNLGTEEFPAICPARCERLPKDDNNWHKIYYIGTLFDGVPFVIGQKEGEDGNKLYYANTRYSFTELYTFSDLSEITEKQISHTSFIGTKTIIAIGYTSGYAIIKDGNGYSMSIAADFKYETTFLATKDDRIITAHNENSELRISELRQISFEELVDCFNINANTAVGDNTTGICTYGDVILWFKESATMIVQGRSPSSYTWDIMSEKIGCIEHKTIAETNKALIWLGRDGVYAFSSSTLPYKISEPVQKYIDNMNGVSSAASDGKKYYLSLKQKTGKFVLLVYDTDFNVWHVEENTGYIQLISCGVEITADENGFYSYSKCNTKIYATDGHEFYELSAGDYRNEWHFVSKPFDMGGASKDSNLYRIYLNVRADEGSTVEVSISKEIEGDNFLSVKRKTYLKATDEKLKIDIKPDRKTREVPYFRVKISGSGRVRVYGMEFALRVKPRTY